jgi:hypothetical protein
VSTGTIAGFEESNIATVTLSSLSSSRPTVEAVMVRGTDWTGEYLIHLDNAALGTGGYQIPAGAAQSAPLPWSNLDQLVVVFSEPVVNLPASLALNGQATGLITFQNLTTAPRPDGSFSATWTASDDEPLPDDIVTFTLPDTITSVGGVPLDGNWTNNGDNYPSGDGTAGGAFNFQFVVLPGDVNQDGFVNLADVADDVVHGFQRSNSGTFSALHDVNGSAIVNAIDAVLIRDHLGSQAARPAAPASVTLLVWPTFAIEVTNLAVAATPPPIRASATRVRLPAGSTNSTPSSPNEVPATVLRAVRSTRSPIRTAAIDRALDDPLLLSR